jgi:hypothetical protein
VGFYHDHERAVGVVHSGENPHWFIVGMMLAPLGCRSVWSSQGEELVHLDVRLRRLGVVIFLETWYLDSRRFMLVVVEVV